MNEHLILVLWFGLGVALQALVLIRGDWNWGRLALCVAFGAIGMVPGKHEHVYEPFSHVLLALGFFAFMFALRFKDDLLTLPRFHVHQTHAVFVLRSKSAGDR